MATDRLTGLESALRQLISDLRQDGVPFALVGGLAVSVRAEPRLTRDADVAVSVADDDQAEALVYRMVERGYRPDAVLEQYVAGRLATARLTHRDRPDVVVDLLFASCGIEPEIVGAAEQLEVLPNLVVPVATAGHLIAMKLLARDDRRRPADADDLRALAAIADDHDRCVAQEAVRLITERGFHRGRDLDAALSALRPDSSGP
ncbi:MAG: nucleotidyl transferase AbiEii/AbiGii toxin family protein [Natronosporangium sp.]